MADRSDIWELADAIQMDARALSAKVVELRSRLSSLNLEDTRPACPACGYRSSMNLPSLAEHLEAQHPELSTA